MFLLLAACALGAAGSLSAQTASGTGTHPDILPQLFTNQDFLEDLALEPAFDLKNKKEVFRFIFSRLPDQVRVYPTENYYYFRFNYSGVPFAGNLRLAAVDRDKGILHFAYFADANASSKEGEMHYAKLTLKDGVSIEKVDDLEYLVGFAGRKVSFLLNDLRDVEPREGLLRPEEKYMGPVFDESGMQFYLVYNTQLKIFHYILNESWGVMDRLEPSTVSDRILIGKRTGFAFYRDHLIDRKYLIAVHAKNVLVNNYYDGPFDQLPDNFLKGDELKEAIEESDPAIKGKIDRYGYIDSGEGRYLIGPYIQYEDQEQMRFIDACARDENRLAVLYTRCFAMQGGGESDTQ